MLENYSDQDLSKRSRGPANGSFDKMGGTNLEVFKVRHSEVPLKKLHIIEKARGFSEHEQEKVAARP